MRRPSPIARLRARAVRPEIAARSRLLELEPRAAEAEMLRRLNDAWREATSNVPYWTALRSDRGLPSEFGALAEYIQAVPVTTRAELKARLADMTSRAAPADSKRITGGSTAEPVQIPAWSSEIEATRADTWIGRSWYGIAPDSPLFMVWGHSHLLGTGWRGWWNGWKRRASDRLLGYRRFSAYDLRPERLREAADELMRFRPAYVVGYSVALDLFARANRDRSAELRQAGVRAVVATAESFPDETSAGRIAELFGCPVAMEYGAVETGVIAHTHPDGGYRVLWPSHLVDVEPSGAGHAVRVTSLFPRAVPLMRYEIGDEVDLDDTDGRTFGVLRFRRVLGRCNDYVELPDGARLHSELFTHAVRGIAQIRGYQFVQDGQRIELRYLADAELPADAVAGIVERLTRIHPGLSRLRAVRSDALERTVAGKTRMIVRRV